MNACTCTNTHAVTRMHTLTYAHTYRHRHAQYIQLLNGGTNINSPVPAGE